MRLSIDEIIENGVAFNPQRKMPMYDIRATVHALFADLHRANVVFYKISASDEGLHKAAAGSS
jgi:hypothetical protein